MTANQEVYRTLTAFLVLGSIPPLLFLIYQIIKDAYTRMSVTFIQFVLFAVYITFISSGIITLYINIHVLVFDIPSSTYGDLAVLRNFLKQIGILFISWGLLYITQQRK